ncbi:MAG TPA: GspH/FimT family pseudopilin [Brevundimonas sp.]|uniref:GspH/FimT family pseudopilin n=1 Tax=Brevundimonas sp. TaxID=1871086 RepID=UPI002E0EE37F|nr:GspH/FimT family pseudopilin [Brevundimonas sp.]
MRRRTVRRRGFTLVELMIVLAIVGLAATAVILTAPDPRPTAAMAADRLVGRLANARAEAILAGRPVALRLDGTGSAALRLGRAGDWAPLDGAGLAAEAWPEGVTPRLEAEATRVTFDPTGLTDPQVLTLQDERGGRAVVVVAATGEARRPQG